MVDDAIRFVAGHQENTKDKDKDKNENNGIMRVKGKEKILSEFENKAGDAENEIDLASEIQQQRHQKKRLHQIKYFSATIMLAILN